MPHTAYLSAIIAAYGRHVTNLAPVQRGYRNHSYCFTTPQGDTLNLIQYKREPGIANRIRRINWLGQSLALSGLPVRTPADPRIVIATGRTITHFGLYNYLPGETIPWEAYTQAHLKLTGLALGRLHQALAALEAPAQMRRHSAAGQLAALLDRMRAYFANPAVATALAAKLHLVLNPGLIEQQADLMNRIAILPGPQLLHLDFVRSNLLFAPAQPSNPLQYEDLALTGILDFEKAAWGAPVIDLARTLAFLLVDCQYKTPRQIRKYFVHSGYTKRGGGSAHQPCLEQLVTFFLTYDLYKFLRHNPYESLRANQHFRRTVAQLLVRNVVSIHASNATIHHKQ